MKVLAGTIIFVITVVVAYWLASLATKYDHGWGLLTSATVIIFYLGAMISADYFSFQE